VNPIGEPIDQGVVVHEDGVSPAPEGGGIGRRHGLRDDRAELPDAGLPDAGPVVGRRPAGGERGAAPLG
jgi:hypothetical protein